jgi:hypothetical protein
VKRFLLPIAASLLAYGLAADPYNTTVDINTTGVSSDGVLFEVTAPDSMSFVFDFTQPGSNSPRDLNKANWAAFENIVASNTPRYLNATAQESYVVTVVSNASYQLVVGVPTVTGTGFDLSRYLLEVSWPTLSGTSRASRPLGNITDPWTVVTGSPGQKSYTLKVTVYVRPTDVPSNYNQVILIPLTIVPTP